jgi:hypothetical protein
LLPLAAVAQQPTTNYDEAAIVPYTLPDLLKTRSGHTVKTAADWANLRRPEVLAMFEDSVFGRTPRGWGKPRFETVSVRSDALGGKAIRKIVRITLPEHPEWAGLELMLHLPKDAKQPVPCFVGANFGGNEAVTSDIDIPLSTRWMRKSKTNGVVDNRSTEDTRGTERDRWPLELILAEGFAVATYYYGDVEPDRNDGWKEGLRAVLRKEGASREWQDGDWGALLIRNSFLRTHGGRGRISIVR